MAVGSLTARFSQHGRVIAENAPDSLVDFHTGEEGAKDESKGESKDESKEGAE